MLRITLTAEDAAALGAPQVVEFEKPRLKEIRELNRQCAVTWAALGERDAAGDVEATAMLVWLAVRRAGVAVDWNDFDLDISGTELEVVGPKDETSTN